MYLKSLMISTTIEIRKYFFCRDWIFESTSVCGKYSAQLWQHYTNVQNGKSVTTLIANINLNLIQNLSLFRFGNYRKAFPNDFLPETCKLMKHKSSSKMVKLPTNRTTTRISSKLKLVDFKQVSRFCLVNKNYFSLIK